MQTRLYRTSLFILFYFCAAGTKAQPAAGPSGNSITLVYDISINTDKMNTGIEEAYNGSTKTIFIQDNNTRIRLVSLMRIQSIFFLKTDSLLKKVLFTKESGQKKYKYSLTPSEWKFYQAKYDSITYAFPDDSLSILGYNCKKAILYLKEGKEEVTAYYSTQLKPLEKFIEPMFAGLPGMVLRYEHTAKKGTIIYTASKISFDKIDNQLFVEPVRGYKLQKYSPSSR